MTCVIVEMSPPCEPHIVLSLRIHQLREKNATKRKVATILIWSTLYFSETRDTLLLLLYTSCEEMTQYRHYLKVGVKS